MRTEVETLTAELLPKSLLRPLTEMGYAPREIENIGDATTVFSHGNQPNVLIAAIVRHLLEVGDMAGEGQAEPFQGRHAPKVSAPFLLMEGHHADQPTRDVYKDVETVLKLPFVNTD